MSSINHFWTWLYCHLISSTVKYKHHHRSHSLILKMPWNRQKVTCVKNDQNRSQNMSQGPLCPNSTKKFQAEVSQMANCNLSCSMVLGGFSVNLNHFKKWYSTFNGRYHPLKCFTLGNKLAHDLAQGPVHTKLKRRGPKRLLLHRENFDFLRPPIF